MTLKEQVLAHWRENRRIVRRSRGKWSQTTLHKYAFSHGYVFIGTDACAFCQEYRIVMCVGCPIAMRTERTNCEETPWREVKAALHGGNKAAILRAMDKQIAFLEEL